MLSGASGALLGGSSARVAGGSMGLTSPSENWGFCSSRVSCIGVRGMAPSFSPSSKRLAPTDTTGEISPASDTRAALGAAAAGSASW